MNWGRGLFRIWLVGSVAWLGVVGWWVFKSLQPYQMTHTPTPAEVEICQKAAENPFYCYDPIVSVVTPELPLWQWAWVVGYAIVPPLLVYLAGRVLWWILRGFSRA
jgi:hypothetical protein